MGIFTDESVLLIRNWEVVRDIFTSEKKLRNELSNFLYSIRGDLRKMDWWSNEWAFIESSGTQLAISKHEWKVGDEFAVWIGVEDFVPESLFGYESFTRLYVWSPGKRQNLTSKLAAQLREKESDIIGEIDQKTSSGYVVRHAVTPCLPEEIDSFEETTRSQIVKFFAHYAKILERYNSSIRESLVEE